jgi:hypothetical protein
MPPCILCMSPIFKVLNYLTVFNEIWYEHKAISDHPNLVVFNSLPVIIVWQAHELLRWAWLRSKSTESNCQTVPLNDQIVKHNLIIIIIIIIIKWCNIFTIVFFFILTSIRPCGLLRSLVFPPSLQWTPD